MWVPLYLSRVCNYAKEEASLLLTVKCLASERVATQFVTGHSMQASCYLSLFYCSCVAMFRFFNFMNTKGKPGWNLPCELHTKHLKRRLIKIRNIQSNAKPSTIARAAKTVHVMKVVNIPWLYVERVLYKTWDAWSNII